MVAAQTIDNLTRRTAPSGGDLVTLALVVCFGIAIRLNRFTERSMWFDEATSWRISSLPWRAMFQAIQADIHAPLYFVVLKAWTVPFGDSLASMRGLSVVFYVVAAVSAFGFAKTAFRCNSTFHAPQAESKCSTYIGLLFAAIITISGFQVRYGVEARMYAMMVALLMVSSWVLFVALRVPDKRGQAPRGKLDMPLVPTLSFRASPLLLRSLWYWGLFGVLGLMLAYTHYGALFSLAVQWLFVVIVLASENRFSLRSSLLDERIPGICLALSIIVLGWLPWLPAFLHQRNEVLIDWWSAPLTTSSAAFEFKQLFAPEHPVSWGEGVAVTAAVLIFGAAVCAPVKGGKAGWYVALLAVGPLLLVIIASIVSTNVFVARYLILPQTFLLLAAAATVGHLRGRVRAAGAMCLLSLTAYGYAGLVRTMHWDNKPGIAGAMEYIAESGDDQSIVVVASPLYYFPCAYHCDAPPKCFLLAEAPVLKHYLGGPFVRESDIITPASLSMLSQREVWTIETDGGWAVGDVEAPEGWKWKEQRRFPEMFGFQGNVVVDRYWVD